MLNVDEQIEQRTRVCDGKLETDPGAERSRMTIKTSWYERLVSKWRHGSESPIHYVSDRRSSPVLRYRYKSRAAAAVAAIHKEMGLSRPIRVLDLGAAEGLTALEMWRLVKPPSSFVCIELSRTMLDSALPMPTSINMRQGDATALPTDLVRGEFDVVTALAFLEHVPDPLSVCCQVADALRTGGIFVATTPVPLWDLAATRTGLLSDAQHAQKLGETDLRKAVEMAGLTVTDYSLFMWAPIAVLPYLSIEVPVAFSEVVDRLASLFVPMRWLFVNQRIVARKERKSV